MAVILSDTEQCTTNRVIEGFLYELATCEDWLIDGEYGEHIPARPYYDQAKHLMHRIPVYKPRPRFKVRLRHLSDKLKRELDGYNNSNDCKSLIYVLKQSVGRIFENIDAQYYHDRVAALLEVELI